MRYQEAHQLAKRMKIKYALNTKQIRVLRTECLNKTSYHPWEVGAKIASSSAEYGRALYPYLCCHCGNLHLSRQAHRLEWIEDSNNEC